MSKVKQEQDAWCVYACLEALDEMDQCDYCSNFIENYLMSDSCHNVYEEAYISDDDYRSAIHDLDMGDDDVCGDTSRYGLFGILGSELEDYLCNVLSYSKYESAIFIEQLNDVDKTMKSPPFLIFNEGDYYGHCTVLTSSVLYDNNWFHPESKITIMDPSDGEYIDIDYNKLMSVSVVFGEY